MFRLQDFTMPVSDNNGFRLTTLHNSRIPFNIGKHDRGKLTMLGHKGRIC
jgi:hypothetical protein